jgi:starch synthase (maltosyl-transferring)
MLILNVWPEIDGGIFPVKREIGDRVGVWADVVREGHGVLQAVLKHRHETEARWSEVPMTLENPGLDRWRGEFTVERLGFHRYTIEAWEDAVATWQEGIRRKREAGLDVTADLEDRPPVERVDVTALGRELEVLVEPVRARFAAWYEMFPRSVGAFRDCEARLADIAAMGFDVVYLPPIHPIGRVNRKGRGNAPVAGPGDPGSPWAIADHMAVHPELGTMDDFDRFVRAAGELGLQVALDLAVQCAPDHVWVQQHPDWFHRRPDGTIRCAENPPKRYEDVYPLKLDGNRPLWEELLRVVLFWIGHGVRAFRVDNPHTKPLAFWAWLIREVKRRHPDVVFLAEAFTRPRLLEALAKLGFSQSYTYFTWRNTKAELSEYLSELTRPPLSEFLRGNLFANTPDILTPYLQEGGRPAFRVRLVLAATLSPLYGIYSGFELCENMAVPGTEEYLHSEKYEYRPRDWEAPGNIRADVARINAIRRQNPALQEYDNLRFLPADGEHILFYGKATPDGSNVILVAVNLDPHAAHETTVHVPVADLGLAEDEAYTVRDLLTDAAYAWRGSANYVRLDPAHQVAHVLRLER